MDKIVCFCHSVADLAWKHLCNTRKHWNNNFSVFFVSKCAIDACFAIRLVQKDDLVFLGVKEPSGRKLPLGKSSRKIPGRILQNVWCTKLLSEAPEPLRHAANGILQWENLVDLSRPDPCSVDLGCEIPTDSDLNFVVLSDSQKLPAGNLLSWGHFIKRGQTCTFQTCTLFSARILALTASRLPSMPSSPPSSLLLPH